MSPFTTWRSRLPAAIGSWFARDLVREAVPLVERGGVALRAVEDLKIEATVHNPPAPDRLVTIEWAGGTGPLALRAVCTDGGSGICPHIVATLEAVRSQTEPALPAPHEADLAWLPTPLATPSQLRARCVWVVFSAQELGGLGASLVLDSPRLRGASRDAAAVLAMMDATPIDDWDDADRDLVRDEAVQEAFAGRPAPKALARALFRLAQHPRLRFDAAPSEGRHPSDLPEFAIDMRGVQLRATRQNGGFVPLLEDAEGERFSPREAALLEGPPVWLILQRTAYLLDGTFDARRVIEVARNGSTTVSGDGAAAELSPGTIVRVAPFLAKEERLALGIVDAADPSAEIALAWTGGALVASLTFIDRATGASAPFTSLGATAPHGEQFVRFGADQAHALHVRLLDAGFVPRSGDAFALHGADRAATFVREVLPQWSDLEQRLDASLRDVARGESEVDIAVSAREPGAGQDWFELQVDVFIGGETHALTQKELATLLSGSGRFAEVRGKLVDIERLRSRRALLTDLAERRSSGFAALVALRDELHETFDRVVLPENVERLRDRLREFAGIEAVEPPALHNGALRAYQERGLDFLCYLSGFTFGGVLADDMGLGKSIAVHCRILTPTGWRRFGDIKVGDAVMNAKGGISRVVGVYPQGMLDAFRVTFSDGASTICSDDHLWAVNTAICNERGNPHQVLPLRTIREQLRDAAGNARHFIPISGPMDFRQRSDLPVHPYLLGCLLGDGSFREKWIGYTTADDEMVLELSSLLPTGTESTALGRYKRAFRRSGGFKDPRVGNPLMNVIKELELLGLSSHNKFVPSFYKLAAVEERIALLQGLLDTDGTIGLEGHIEFTTVSDQLAQDVAFLVRSLGGVARMRYRGVPRYRYKGELRVGSPAYRVSIALPDGVQPFRLARKAERYRGRSKYPPCRGIVDVTPIGKYEMQCIAVDAADQLFVVDDFIVTHNTVQVISHLLRRKAVEGPAPALVIAPTSVTHTWENEIARFAPELTTLRLHSGNERAAKYDAIENTDVVITSYAIARLDAHTLAQHRFRTLVLDEAQNAKNPSSQISRVLRTLHADHRLALTGTPIENSLRDLWAIFAFVEPGLLGSETSFRRRFELPIQGGDERAASTLRSRLEPFVLRRTKEDVAPELPERVEVELECDLSPLQRRLYRGVAEAARREVFAHVDSGGIESATVHVLAALTRLRQICAHPGLLFDEYRDEPEASGKFDAFLETVDEVLSGGHRLLVFSAFASMLRIMRLRLDAQGLTYGYLDGSTRDRDRNLEVERFMRSDGPPLFLCSLKAGGVGLTLTAADYVILYDPWWNPAVERQAIDRTHRIGQHRSVTAYRLVSRGSVEEKIRALAERKADLSRNVIKADSTVAKSLTRSDLELLLADPD